MVRKKLKKARKKSLRLSPGQAIKKSLPKAETEKIKRIKIRVIGIGGGERNIVSELAQKVGKVTFFTANTDFQVLGEASRKVKPLPFGQNFT